MIAFLKSPELSCLAVLVLFVVIYFTVLRRKPTTTYWATYNRPGVLRVGGNVKKIIRELIGMNNVKEVLQDGDEYVVILASNNIEMTHHVVGFINNGLQED